MQIWFNPYHGWWAKRAILVGTKISQGCLWQIFKNLKMSYKISQPSFFYSEVFNKIPFSMCF
jgi:hypothetical protein